MTDFEKLLERAKAGDDEQPHQRHDHKEGDAKEPCGSRGQEGFHGVAFRRQRDACNVKRQGKPASLDGVQL